MDNFSKHIVRFNAFQIKIIALITMTLDHIGAYQTFTFSREINDGLRVVGRIAAPLFLFMVVEGLRYTRSKPKYILRLYIAGIVIEMINRILSKATGAFEFGNTDLIKCAFRANMCTAERKKTKNGGKHNDKI